ncbi:MAG: type II toxin-antitoxin system RelE/ParE family toxin [Candidatus Korarchaeota archaeon]|nr:type II toxin-antitoxin system RelE/ParE family toxin [Candidatus Korarchaeota archaeon]NIR46956.1 type II toxin-antitoxin system RelE/ParE family toxin [candidate division KSB1 bacterium]NIS22567.1 type II toxin-antitoxin system RelE/ParE family toxin [candidate division KSB1 bacterium]NIU23065.1 type II toxin-antitoxin system RelE/ParE family toxin [candidate division KSB1 bacterium]NIU92136.1 type II toxin-antitoxin system RelE/ParE family toxin [candidate division KSB1 bacterium]
MRRFKQSWLEEFWDNGKHKRVPNHLQKRLIRKLDMLNSAQKLRDLNSPPSNHLHPLHGDRKGQWAISVSGAWRLCFKFEDGDVFDIELVQYH